VAVRQEIQVCSSAMRDSVRTSVHTSPGKYALLAAAVLAGAAITLFAMGQVPICRCGYVKP
jgi:hypothetical protein